MATDRHKKKKLYVNKIDIYDILLIIKKNRNGKRGTTYNKNRSYKYMTENINY